MKPTKTKPFCGNCDGMEGDPEYDWLSKSYSSPCRVCKVEDRIKWYVSMHDKPCIGDVIGVGIRAKQSIEDYFGEYWDPIYLSIYKPLLHDYLMDSDYEYCADHQSACNYCGGRGYEDYVDFITRLNHSPCPGCKIAERIRWFFSPPVEPVGCRWQMGFNVINVISELESYFGTMWAKEYLRIYSKLISTCAVDAYKKHLESANFCSREELERWLHHKAGKMFKY